MQIWSHASSSLALAANAIWYKYYWKIHSQSRWTAAMPRMWAIVIDWVWRAKYNLSMRGAHERGGAWNDKQTELIFAFPCTECQTKHAKCVERHSFQLRAICSARCWPSENDTSHRTVARALCSISYVHRSATIAKCIESNIIADIHSSRLMMMMRWCCVCAFGWRGVRRMFSHISVHKRLAHDVCA